MEIALPEIFSYLESNDVARCESVCKYWLHLCNTHHVWKALCSYYFSILPETIEALRHVDSDKPEFWQNKTFVRSQPKKHIRKLDLYDYLDYYLNNQLSPWKRLFLFLTLFYNQSADRDYREMQIKMEQTFFCSKKREKTKMGGEDSRELESELPLILAEELVTNFITSCKSNELELILDNCLLQDILTNAKQNGTIESRFINAMSTRLFSMKKQRGYKIDKNSQDAISMLFRIVMYSLPLKLTSKRRALAEQTLPVLDENYALEAYTEIFNIDCSELPFFAAMNWQIPATHILAYLGAPIIIPSVLKRYRNALFLPYSDSEYALFDDEKYPEDLEKERKAERKKKESDEVIDLSQSMFYLYSKIGITGIAAYLLSKDPPEDPTISSDLLNDLTNIVVSDKLDESLKFWALTAIVEHKELYEFCITEDKQGAAMFPLKALTCANQTWSIRRLAQRLLVRLGQKEAIDLKLVLRVLDMVVENTDLASLPISTSISLGDQGDLLCWALFILIQLGLGDKQKYIQLAQQLIIAVPNLSEDLRTDILKYFGPFVRNNMHPRWLLETTLKGIEFKDGRKPHWTRYDQPVATPPQVAESKMYQKNIVNDIGDKLRHLGFVHCTELSLLFGSGGTFYGLLLAPSNTDAAVELSLSEVGPYARLRLYRPQYFIPDAISEQTPNDVSTSEMLAFLRTVLLNNGIKIMQDPELNVNLSNFGFCTDLGNVGITVEKLLFYISD